MEVAMETQGDREISREGEGEDVAHGNIQDKNTRGKIKRFI
jgi:hypothetical protein